MTKKDDKTIMKVLSIHALGQYVTLAMASGTIGEFSTFEQIAEQVEKDLPKVRDYLFKVTNK